MYTSTLTNLAVEHGSVPRSDGGVVYRLLKEGRLADCDVGGGGGDAGGAVGGAGIDTLVLQHHGLDKEHRR